MKRFSSRMTDPLCYFLQIFDKKPFYSFKSSLYLGQPWIFTSNLMTISTFISPPSFLWKTRTPNPSTTQSPPISQLNSIKKPFKLSKIKMCRLRNDFTCTAIIFCLMWTHWHSTHSLHSWILYRYTMLSWIESVSSNFPM